LGINAQFHEELLRLSGNPFFVQTLERLNALRRLVEYRSMLDRKRLYDQCKEHVEIIDTVSRGEMAEASHMMRRHLGGALERKSPIQKRFEEAKKAK
jgi:DNA-binding GntR family transcriptional regulator